MNSTPLSSFQDLTLNPAIQKAITELGYEKPSPIQAQALPLLLGRDTDFLGLAATGTGKTAAFSIPMLERIANANAEGAAGGVQALILCPTRELALQVSEQIRLLGKHLGIKVVPIYGGAGYGDQIYGLKHGAQVVVGTPGRVMDHLEKGTLKLDSLSTLILDEADEMISMGFKEDIEAILEQAPMESSNIWLFSATMSSEVRRVADEYLREPEMVQINRTEMLPSTVEQIYYMTQESNKPEVLCRLIDGAGSDFYGLIFCQTKALVVDVKQMLVSRGYPTDCLHGDMDQTARERTMRAFRDRKVTVLVCTDVASRGLDVKDVTHVINYSIPRELDNYVHRIGRTGRSGKSGLALSLVTPSHRVLIGRIERMTRSKMREGKVPTRKEIATMKVSNLLVAFQAQTGSARAIELMDLEWARVLAELSGEEIAGRFLAMMNPEIFAERGETAQLNAPSKNGPRIAPNTKVSSSSAQPAAAAPVLKAEVRKPALKLETIVAAIDQDLDAAESRMTDEPALDAEAGGEARPRKKKFGAGAKSDTGRTPWQPRPRFRRERDEAPGFSADRPDYDNRPSYGYDNAGGDYGFPREKKKGSFRKGGYNPDFRSDKPAFGESSGGGFSGGYKSGFKKKAGFGKPYGEKKSYGDKPYGKKPFGKPASSFGGGGALKRKPGFKKDGAGDSWT